MKGKTVMITGATAGIGKHTALEIARQGALVVIVGRDEAKSRQTVGWIKQETGSQQVDYLLADLSSIDQTHGVAQEFNDRYDRLDVLVNNVGSIFTSRDETVDGIESTFALNHLVGYFLLSHLLLDKIKASAPARIVSVSSAAHFQGKMQFDDLELKQSYGGLKAYAQSKLANLLFTYELARRLEGSGVTANALHPGVVASNFGVTNNDKFWAKPLRKLFDLFSISEAKGAQTSLYLATSPVVEGVTGKYFDKCQETHSSAASYNQVDQERLWSVSQQKVGLPVEMVG